MWHFPVTERQNTDYQLRMWTDCSVIWHAWGKAHHLTCIISQTKCFGSRPRMFADVALGKQLYRLNLTVQCIGIGFQKKEVISTANIHVLQSCDTSQWQNGKTPTTSWECGQTAASYDTHEVKLIILHVLSHKLNVLALGQECLMILANIAAGKRLYKLNFIKTFSVFFNWAFCRHGRTKVFDNLLHKTCN